MTQPAEPENDGFMPIDTGRSLPIALLRAREVVMERFRPLLARHNITEQQWRVIRVLGEVKQMEASRVAEQACILNPSLTRISRTLEAAGLIKSARDTNDRRRMLLALTGKGRALINDVSPESTEIYKKIEAAFGQCEMAQLLDLLDALQRDLKSAAGKK